jgi:hypothetical protein
MFGVFGLLSGTWLVLLLRPSTKQQVYKIHWLMLALVCCKTLTLMAQVGPWGRGRSN